MIGKNMKQSSKNGLYNKIILMGILFVTAISISGCSAIDTNKMLIPQTDNEQVSIFEENTTLTGNVIENNNGCVRDVTCYLRIEFKDKIVNALYGLGDIPNRPCIITKDVSDRAFDVEKSELITVVISTCGSEGYYITKIE